MKFATAALALGAALAVASSALPRPARAEPEVMVKCDGVGPAQRFTRDTGWKPYPNPDRSIVITREKGKLGMELVGDAPISSHGVLALPQHEITTFRVLGHNGIQNFHVVLGAYSGKPELKHSTFGAKDGSGTYHQEETTLTNCSVVNPDVAVPKEAVGLAPK
jgi:hypothetical protein